MSDPTRYPLAWPTGWPRTTSGRAYAPFSKRVTMHSSQPGGSSWTRKEQLTIGDGLTRLETELRRFGAKNIVVSANLRRNLDGSITANQAKMLADPGIAVYFKINGKDRVLACDRWYSAAENMAAIAGHIAAMRAQERYGVGTLDQAFAGYAALPPKGSTWRTTLGFMPDQHVTVEMIDAAFRRLAQGAHPDQQGGSHDAMTSLTAARMEGKDELAT